MMEKPERLLITGGDGFIGSRLVRFFFPDYDVIPTVLASTSGSPRAAVEMDITDPDRVLEVVGRVKPDLILHTAGIKDVKLCEREKETAKRVNELGTAHVAEASVKCGAFLVYLSTDYVFDGSKGMYAESDAPDPGTVYGKTKYGGEVKIGEICGTYAVCRTSAVFAGTGRNVVSFILGELRAGRKQVYFTDIFNTPTYIGSLAEMLRQVLRRRRHGIFHVAGRGRISRHGLAESVARVFRFDPSLVIGEEVGEERRKANLWPFDVSLDVGGWEKSGGAGVLDVQEGLEAVRERAG